MFGGTTAYSGGGGMWFPGNPVLAAGRYRRHRRGRPRVLPRRGRRSHPAWRLQGTYVRGGQRPDRVPRGQTSTSSSRCCPGRTTSARLPQARLDGMRHIACNRLRRTPRRAGGTDARSAGHRPTRRGGTDVPRRRAGTDRPITDGHHQHTPDSSLHLNTAWWNWSRPSERRRRRDRRERRPPAGDPSPRGVLLAAGGFENNDELRERFGVPGEARDTMGPWGNSVWRTRPEWRPAPTPT